MMQVENRHKTFAWLLTAILLFMQVGFPVLHDHQHAAAVDKDLTWHVDHTDGEQLAEECTLCDQFFSQAAVLSSDITLTLASAAFTTTSALISQTSKSAVQYFSSRAPPML